MKEQRQMQENWRIIEGFPGYRVSSRGQVIGKYGKVLRHHLINGYATVALYRDGTHNRVLVHRLVAEAFIGAQPDGKQVAHEDGDRLNNTAENLKWKTPKENGEDKVRHGTSARREGHGRAKLTEEDVALILLMNGKMRTKRRVWGRVTIARELGLPLHAVSNLLLGRTWQGATQ